MDIPCELEGLEEPQGSVDTSTAPQAPPKRSRKPKAPPEPPKPPPTPEELAASAAIVQAVRDACAHRETGRDSEREASRLATHTGSPRPGGQVYWSTSGRMVCGKCDLYCDAQATHEASHCMGHARPVDPAQIEEMRALRIRSDDLMREEEDRRRASRNAGRIASRATAKANPWR